MRAVQFHHHHTKTENVSVRPGWGNGCSLTDKEVLCIKTVTVYHQAKKYFFKPLKTIACLPDSAVLHFINSLFFLHHTLSLVTKHWTAVNIRLYRNSNAITDLLYWGISNTDSPPYSYSFSDPLVTKLLNEWYLYPALKYKSTAVPICLHVQNLVAWKTAPFTIAGCTSNPAHLPISPLSLPLLVTLHSIVPLPSALPCTLTALLSATHVTSSWSWPSSSCCWLNVCSLALAVAGHVRLFCNNLG